VFAVQVHQYQTLTVFELQALLMALTITGFFLGVTVEERERAAFELRESLRLAAAGEMAAALAHELNQPLTALSSYAKASQLLAQSRDSGRAQLLETLQKLVNEATRAADVVRRLRDFFSTGATHLRDASLPKLVASVIESLRPRAETTGVRIQLRAPERLPCVLIDSLQIEVVIRNLIVNAIEAVADAPGDKKSIMVEIDPDNAGNIQLTVTDSGPGITLDRMQYLFEPFSTTKATGMGMGLAISRAIVEGHGGTLWARPGSRGVLGFTLPLREAADG
jgi:two-component system, LuxR family, sensor kinase FixL